MQALLVLQDKIIRDAKRERKRQKRETWVTSSTENRPAHILRGTVEIIGIVLLTLKK